MKVRSTHAVEKIEQLMILRILSGEFAHQECLPTRKELAKEYDVNQLTVGAAMGRLVARGLCVSRTGLGMVAVPLIHAVDHKLLLQLVKEAEDLDRAMKLLTQVLAIVRKVLVDAASEAATKRDDSHVRAVQELAELPAVEGPEPEIEPLIEYSLWRVITGASGNVAATALLNALRPLWLEPEIMRGIPYSAEGPRIRALANAIVQGDAASAAHRAGELLAVREKAVQRSSTVTSGRDGDAAVQH